MREQLVEAILARFDEVRRTGDFAAVLAEDALDEADSLLLRVSGPASTPDLPVDVVAFLADARAGLAAGVVAPVQERERQQEQFQFFYHHIEAEAKTEAS